MTGWLYVKWHPRIRLRRRFYCQKYAPGPASLAIRVGTGTLEITFPRWRYD